MRRSLSAWFGIPGARSLAEMVMVKLRAARVAWATWLSAVAAAGLLGSGAVEVLVDGEVVMDRAAAAPTKATTTAVTTKGAMAPRISRDLTETIIGDRGEVLGVTPHHEVVGRGWTGRCLTKESCPSASPTTAYHRPGVCSVQTKSNSPNSSWSCSSTASLASAEDRLLGNTPVLLHESGFSMP